MVDPVWFGLNLYATRLGARLTQSALARRAQISRLKIVRAESGSYEPSFAEVMQLAAALDVPLEQFASGRPRPSRALSGIATELRHLGITDLKVAAARPPGAFRPAEEVVALAARGDRPPPRVIDALPYVLTRREFDPHLLLAFARRIDPRVRRRLAWLADVSLVLCQHADFPPAESTAGLERLAALVRLPSATDPVDALGYPTTGRPPLLWRRWRVTYATDLDGFRERASGLFRDSGANQ